MKNRIVYFLISITFVLLNSCSNSALDYIDINYPSDTSKAFAESVFQSQYDYIQSLDISTNKKEYFFQLTNKNWSFDKILCLSVNNDGLYIFDTIVDSKTNDVIKHCGEPCISKDGKELFFSSLGDIWKMSRVNGVWESPVKLGTPVNSDWKDGHPSISNNGTLYFHSFEKDPLNNSVFFSELHHGKYLERTKIDILSEVGDAGDPGIAPDESFIVFGSSREGGFGNTDLYISLKTKNGWSSPENLGENINTSDWELGPKISPDGKYLFYYRRDTWKNAKYSKIYWVNIEEIIKELLHKIPNNEAKSN